MSNDWEVPHIEMSGHFVSVHDEELGWGYYFYNEQDNFYYFFYGRSLDYRLTITPNFFEERDKVDDPITAIAIRNEIAIMETIEKIADTDQKVSLTGYLDSLHTFDLQSLKINSVHLPSNSIQNEIPTNKNDTSSNLQTVDENPKQNNYPPIVDNTNSYLDNILFKIEKALETDKQNMLYLLIMLGIAVILLVILFKK